MKKFLCVLFVLVVSFGLIASAQASEAIAPIVVEEIPSPDKPIYVLGKPIKEAYYADEDGLLFIPYLAVAEKLGYEHDDFVIGEEENTLTLTKPAVAEEGILEHAVTLVFTVDGYGYVPSIFTTIDEEELEILDSAIAIEGEFMMTLDVFSMLFGVYAYYDEESNAVNVINGNPTSCYLGGAGVPCGGKLGIDGCAPTCTQDCGEDCAGECFVPPTEVTDNLEVAPTATPFIKK